MLRFFYSLLLVCLLAGRLACGQSAGSLDPFDVGPIYSAGQIQASVTQVDGKIVIAGLFDQAGGEAHRNLARLQADGSIESGFAAATDGKVAAIALQADGQILIAGDFLHVNGVSRPAVARLKTDGTLDTSFNPSIVSGGSALAVQGDGLILLAGTFSSGPGLVRLQADGTTDPSFSTPFGGRVSTLVLLSGGNIFAGGALTAGYGAIVLKADGEVVFSSREGLVNAAVALPDGTFIYGSPVVSAAGVSSLTRGSPDGTQSAFSLALSSSAVITALARQADGQVLVGGVHLLEGDDPAGVSVVRLKADGSLDRSVPVMNGSINSLGVSSDQSILVAGSFDTIDRTFCRGVARLGGDLSVSPAFVPTTRAVGAHVRTVAVQGDGRILVAGPFVNIGGQDHHGLARLNADGTVDAGFQADLAGSASAILVQDDERIVIAGSMRAINARPCQNLARLAGDGTFDSSFAPSLDGSVLCVASQADGKLLVGGYFTHLNGAAASRVARLNADGTTDSFPAWASGPVRSLAVDATGRVLLTGAFDAVNGGTRNGLARLNGDGSLDAGFVSKALNCQPSAVLLQRDGKILVAGEFTQSTTALDYHIMRLHDDGTIDLSFAGLPGIYYPNIPRTIALQADGKALFGFEAVLDTSRPSPVRLLSTGPEDPLFKPARELNVASVALLPDGRVILAGAFDSIDGVPRSGLAILDNDPAVQSLSAGPSSVTWLRRGSAPEISRATFDYSSDGSAWSPLGAGARIPGGWQLVGLSLPTGSGWVRARGPSAAGAGDAGASQVEQRQAILLQPELAVEQPAGTPLVSGAGTPAFTPADSGPAGGHEFTVRNTGSAPLPALHLTLSGPNAGEFAVSAQNLPALAPGASAVFKVTFAPTASGQRLATLLLSGDDPAAGLFTLPLAGADNTGPTVQLTGSATIAIAMGGTFQDPGAVGADAEDGTLTPAVTGSIDTTTPGQYVLTYTVTDRAGAVASVQRSVRVVAMTTAALGQYLSLSVPSLSGIGAVVHYPALPATDQNGQPLSVVFSRPDGSLLPLGRTVVGVTVTDSQGHATYANFAVSVVPPPGTKLPAAAWGSNSLGQLGMPISQYGITPAAVGVAGTPLEGRGVVALAGGSAFSLALCSDGSLFSWGDNALGELGERQPSTAPVAVAVAGSVLEGKTVVAIAAGAFHGVALCSDGTLASWGDGSEGQMGNGANSPFNLAPVAVQTTGTALEGKLVVDIAAAGNHTLALCQDGTMVAWGSNDFGELGDGTMVARATTPVAVSTTAKGLAGRSVAAMAAGTHFSLALCADGTLALWGALPGVNQGASNPLPATVAVSGTALAGKSVQAIAAGDRTALALCADGTLAAWGDGTAGEIGNGNNITPSGPTPVTVTGTPLAGRSIAAIAMDGSVALALCTDGSLAAWGPNAFAQLGVSPQVLSRSALPYAIDPPMALVGRGPSAYHNLAAFANLPKLSLQHAFPVDAGFADRSSLANQATVNFATVTIGSHQGDDFAIGNVGFSDLSGITVSVDGPDADEFVVTALPDPVVAPGGFTQFGVRFTPRRSGAGSAVLHVASNDPALPTMTIPLTGAGNFSPTIALNGTPNVTLEAGAVFNDPGATGSDPEDGPLTASVTGNDTSYAGVHTLTYTVRDSQGVTASVTRSLTIYDDLPPVIDSAPDLTLPGSGYNGAYLNSGFNAQAHDNGRFSTSYSASLPYLAIGRHVVGVTVRDSGGNTAFQNFVVSVPPSTGLSIRTWGDRLQGRADGGFNIHDATAVSATPRASLAVTANQGVTVWGTLDPALTHGADALHDVVDTAAGGLHALALRSDGTVFAWGSDLYGQASVPAGMGDVVAIAAGGRHSLALKRDGTVVAWGDDALGQVRGAASLRNIIGIAAGDSFSLALRSDGTVAAWGSDAAGQVSGAAACYSVVALAAGERHALALKADGTVTGWGADDSGQVSGAAGLGGVIAIAAGRAHSLALKGDGTCAAWGADELQQVSGAAGLMQLGAIAAGGDHSLALTFNPAATLDAVQPDEQVAGQVHLAGTLPPAEYAATNAYFEYATSDSFGAGSTVVPAQVSGYNAVASVAGLSSHQAYYFRLMAPDSFGSSNASNVVLLALSNQPPTASDAIFESPNGTGFDLDVLAGAADPDHDTLTVADVYAVAGGDAKPNARGDRVTFTPRPGFTGQGSFDYAISDGHGGAASAHVTLHDTVAPTLTVPVSYTITAGVAGGATVNYPSMAVSDAVTAAPAVVCVPPSGSLLAVGEHPVSITCTDLAGNVTRGAFTVTVLPPPPVGVVVAAKSGLIGDVDLPATAAWRTFGAPGFGAGAPLFSATYSLTARSPISSGIFTANGLVLGAGDSAPGVSKGKFAAFAEPVGGPTGFAFTATTLPAVGQGLWSNLFSADGTPALIAGVGLHPAALPGFSYRTIPAVSVGASGDLFWLTTLAGPKVTAANALALFGQSSAAGGAKLLLRAGQQSGGHTVVSFIALQSASSPFGYGAGQSDGGSVTPVLLTLEHGLRAVAVVGPDHDLEIKALLGAATVPGLAAAKWQSFSIPAAGSSGLIAFHATVLSGKTTLSGLFAEAPGAPLRKVALQGDPVASLPGLTITDMSDPILNAAGDVAFVATLAGPHVTSLNNEALYLWTVGAAQPTLIVRKGVPAPDANGLSLSAITGFGLPERPGSVVYMGTLRSGATGLWAVNSAGTIQRLALTGTTVAGHSLRTIGAFQNVLGSARQARTAAAPQHVIFRATFSDLSQAVIQVAVP